MAGAWFSVHVSTHSRLKAAGRHWISIHLGIGVSTHSRLKAAGNAIAFNDFIIVCFNTQPPEGGWLFRSHLSSVFSKFQHTAA